MDEHVPGPITQGLRQRQVDVLTAQEDGHEGVDDFALFERSVGLGRVLVTFDKDYLAIAASWQAAGQTFPGVVMGKRRLGYRASIEDLELIAKCSEPSEWAGRLTRLPL